MQPTAPSLPPPPSNIAGEALLAAVKLSEVFGDKPLQLTAAHLKAAKGLADLVVESIEAFLRGKPRKIAPERAKFDPDEVFAALRRPVDELNLVERLQFDESADMTGPFTQAFGTVFAYLQEIAPARSKMTVLGPRDIAPGPLEVARFRVAWEVCEDPTLVLHELAQGRVPRRYVEVLSRAYPDLYEHIRTAILEACVRLRGEDPTWEPSYRQDRALQALLMTSTMNTRLVAEVQALHARAVQQDAAAKSERAAKSTQLDANATPAQRSL